MPISDVLSAFELIQHDPQRVCDLFEETPLEKRVQLNHLVKLRFNLSMSQLYYKVTQCVASLHFDFDNSIPQKFENDAFERILSDGQILDREMTGYCHVDEELETPQLRTPMGESMDVVASVEHQAEVPHSPNYLPPPEFLIAMDSESIQYRRVFLAQVAAKQQLIAAQLDSGVSDFNSLTLAHETPNESTTLNVLPVVHEDERAGCHQVTPAIGRSRIIKTTDPSKVRRHCISRFTSVSQPRPDTSDDENAFDIKHVTSKRRRTDDIIIDEVNHQGLTAYVTSNLETAIQLAKEYPGSKCIKLASLNFICPNQTHVTAQQYALWLYSQIEDGHLKLN